MQFNFTGGQLGVDQLCFAGFDFSRSRHNPFAAKLASVLEDGGRAGVGIEHQLGEALTIAKVDENEFAVVAVGVNPAGDLGFVTDVGFAELAAGVGAVSRGLHVESPVFIYWVTGVKEKNGGVRHGREMLTPRLAVYFGQPVGIGVHGGDYTGDGASVKALCRQLGKRSTLNFQRSTFK
jgi:hypothetical protein